MMQVRVTFALPLVLFALALGCGDDPKPSKPGGAGGSGGAQGGTGGSGGTQGGTGGAGGMQSGSGGAGGMQSGSGGAGGSGGAMMNAQCGDGIVEGTEACDDGNTMSGDYCEADCSAVTGACGDGTQQGNETCDDGTITMNCDTYTNGGDGKCVPAGTCSPGYFLSGNQCIPLVLSEHVHIMVDNFCNMSVMPLEYTVPAGQKLKLSYHNHSMDYPVDVWLQYGGGYLDLMQGATWNDMYEHCFGPAPSENYADITTACSSFKLKIHCL